MTNSLFEIGIMGEVPLLRKQTYGLALLKLLFSWGFILL